MKTTKPRKTHEQFCKDVHNMVGDEYTVIGTYEKARNKIEMRHNADCNHVWSPTADNFLRGNRCPVCAPKNSKPKSKYGSKKYEVVSNSVVDKMSDDELLQFNNILYEKLVAVRKELKKRMASQN